MIVFSADEELEYKVRWAAALTLPPFPFGWGLSLPFTPELAFRVACPVPYLLRTSDT